MTEQTARLRALAERLMVLREFVQLNGRAKCESDRASNMPCFTVHPARPELWCSPCVHIGLSKALREAADVLSTLQGEGERPQTGGEIWKCRHCGYVEAVVGGDWERAELRRVAHEAQCPSNPNGPGHPLHGHVSGATPARAEGSEPAQPTDYERVVKALLRERSDELTKEACDRCENCGLLVMCSFHSVMSVLAGHTQVQDERGEWVGLPAAPPESGERR